MVAAAMTPSAVWRTLVSFLLSASLVTAEPPTPLPLRARQWSEEFSYPSYGPLDSTRWSYDIGNGEWGWGNGEVQQYSDSMQNVRVEDGKLVLAVERDNGVFKSGRVRTNGKVEFQYGSVEAAIKLPNLANGLWPAFWLLGSNFHQVSWPYCGELDIMEAGQAISIKNGTVNQVVSSAAHWSHEGNYATYGEHVTSTQGSFVNEWQVFRMDWTPDRVSTFVNGQHIWTLYIGACRETGECSEFHQPFFFIANVAVGGRFTGIMDATDITASPGQMEIDYIRIYDNDDVNATMTTGGMLQAPPSQGEDSAVDNGAGSNNNVDNSNNEADYGVVDCGKPDTCTASVLGTSVPAGGTCFDHIEYLMNERGRDELYACDSVARKSFPAECGGCDPGTGAPYISYQFNKWSHVYD